MRWRIWSVVGVVAGVLSFAPVALRAAGDDAAFLAAYRQAFAAKDAAALHGFLYTKGADPMALEFYKSMVTQDLGNPKAVITLETLSAEDAEKAAKPKDGPGGRMALTLRPSRKLVTAITTADDNGTSTSTSSCFVAEHDGTLVIPVPGPVK